MIGASAPNITVRILIQTSHAVSTCQSRLVLKNRGGPDRLHHSRPFAVRKRKKRTHAGASPSRLGLPAGGLGRPRRRRRRNFAPSQQVTVQPFENRMYPGPRYVNPEGLPLLRHKVRVRRLFAERLGELMRVGSVPAPGCVPPIDGAGGGASRRSGSCGATRDNLQNLQNALSFRYTSNWRLAPGASQADQPVTINPPATAPRQ